MAKYNNERDFVQQEFMKNLDPTQFILDEDKDNYYIMWLNELEDGTKEKLVFVTLYKDKISEVMKEYEKENEKND